MRGGPGPGSEAPILEAIHNAGLLGITAKQLALTTGRPVASVESSLQRLSESTRVLRVGKGLWILPKFAGEPRETQGFRGPAWYLERFLQETGVEPGGNYPGEIQFNPNEELPVHRWWPYVQGFSADFVRRTLQENDIGPGKVVLDPFAGSGTVSVETRVRGARAIASELMPVAAFVIRAKHTWEVSSQSLLGRGLELVSVARSSEPAPLPFLRETRRQFSPGALDSLLRLRAALEKVPEGPPRRLLALSFAGILVASSRLKRSPCLGYARKPPVGRETPFALFRASVERICSDLEGLRARRGSLGPAAEVLEGNAQSLDCPDASVDLAITSPPYVNGMDYVMNYKLEMAWLGLVRSYEDLSDLKSRMVACDNLSPLALRGYEPGPAVREDPWLPGILAGIRGNIASKSIYRRKDMAEIVGKYFDDLVPVISEVHRTLRPGGRFVVVNGDSLMAGTYVPGDLLFAHLATRAGFRVERFETARVRRSGQRRDFRLRESVLTLRKKGPGPIGRSLKR